jgi:Fe-S oxidoreductase
MDEPAGQRVNEARIAQALSTGAEVVGVACPFCMIMLDDALKARQAVDEAPSSVRVADISQVLLDATRRRSQTAPTD